MMTTALMCDCTTACASDGLSNNNAVLSKLPLPSPRGASLLDTDLTPQLPDPKLQDRERPGCTGPCRLGLLIFVCISTDTVWLLQLIHVSVKIVIRVPDSGSFTELKATRNKPEVDML